MKQFGLIGYPLGHSFSPAYFKQKFEREKITGVRYDAFELKSIDEFPAFLKKHPLLCGLNVTIPYKESVIPFLDELHPVAAEIGSVNTVVFRDGKIIGYNTDLSGIAESLKPHLEWYMMNALILGTGGSAKTVAYFLSKIGIQVNFVSRNPEGENQLAYAELTEDIIQKNKLIINCSPAGMYPNIEQKPDIPYNGISDMHVLFDLIYNPPFSAFLNEAAMRGASYINGEKMLRTQAEASWNLWMKA